MMVRFGAWIRRTVERMVSPLPYFPDPAATCPAHGNRLCPWCSRGNPRECDQCEWGPFTGMHWDTCANRVR